MLGKAAQGFSDVIGNRGFFGDDQRLWVIHG